jgi:hypothetical protein
MIYIYPYNPGSKSARLLSEAMIVPRIKHRGSRFRGSERKTVINWGSGYLMDNPAIMACGRIINMPGRVRLAQCKLRTFRRIQEVGGIRIPEFTTDREVALGWLLEGDVCSRLTTTGHEGMGLTVHPRGSNDLPNCPLYVKYIKKKEEYRVHVIGDQTYTQRKLRRRGAEGDHKVRNTANGYVFSGQYVAPDDVLTQAKAAVRSLGLDFGAVDVVWNRHNQQAWVLEINTAPGIEGRTVDVYASALEELISGRG